jgi:hypothetical protein
MPTTVPYFAYGANLASATLARRGIAPAPPSTVAQVTDPHTALVFVHRGGYATLATAAAGVAEAPWQWLKLPPPSTAADGLVFWRPYGVVYELTEVQLEAIAVKEIGYRQTEVAVTAEGQEVTAVAFLSSPWTQLRRPVAPTQRYRDLILSGARERGLPEEYVGWLDGVAVVAPSALGTAAYSDTPAEAAGKVLGVGALVAAGVLAAGVPH